MVDYSKMSVSELIAASQDEIETEDDLESFLKRAYHLVVDADPGLAFAFCVLAGEPSDIAAMSAAGLANIVHRFPAGSDSAALANAVSAALQQFED